MKIAICILVCVICGGLCESEQLMEEQPEPSQYDREYCFAAAANCRGREILEKMGEANKLPDPQFLSLHCNDVISGLSCVAEELSKCIPKQAEHVRAFLTTARTFCDVDNSLRQDYIESVDCLNENKDVMQVCYDAVFQTLKTFPKLILGLESHDELNPDIAICMSTMLLKSCIVGGISKSCGSAGARVVDVLWEGMPILIVEECPEAEARRIVADISDYIRKPDIPKE